MNLSCQYKEALGIFENKMASEDLEHFYTGSTALHLHGLDIHPSDIDIVASEDAFNRLDNSLSNTESRRTTRTTYRGKSRKATTEELKFDIFNVPFDVLKNPEYHLPEEVFNVNECSTTEMELEVDFKDDSLHTTEPEKYKVDVIDLDELKTVYSIGGRHERAEMIEKYWGEQERSELSSHIDHIDYLELGEYAKKNITRNESYPYRNDGAGSQTFLDKTLGKL